MSTGVYFRKNCEAMLLLIKTNINFIFHHNAAIYIVGIITADTDVRYHKNLFLEIYIRPEDGRNCSFSTFLSRNENSNKLSSLILFFSSDVETN